MTEPDFTQLTRRADEHRPDCWRIYCGDICAGWIAKASTTSGQSEWQWRVAMENGMRPGEGRGGSADTFDEAKAAFLPAWLAFARSRKPEDFEAYRFQRDHTEWKYAMRDRGLPLPTASTTGRAKCYCGTTITIATTDDHIRTAHRETFVTLPSDRKTLFLKQR